ncbi:hypothetical protein ASPBRDRAFT_190706 [Aspergillus brasiliensis CBS 101740]|uniref:Uncharacterized protein n=1 Tax=Aspergillus brasiliensis (strain CBS 101740 / IMI 381727 / IBT 21946) TaxID=767769 RepID=A0A1L9V0F7_ASPBC|nr:hypothetical protein ASPBRDRAFT_190706 [Aspergillus brasiliensis CBS 101740]
MSTMPDEMCGGIVFGATKTGKPRFLPLFFDEQVIFLARSTTNSQRTSVIVVTFAGPNIPIRVRTLPTMMTGASRLFIAYESYESYDVNDQVVLGHHAAFRDDELARLKLLVDRSPVLDIRRSNPEGIVDGGMGIPGGMSGKTVIGRHLGALRSQIRASCNSPASCSGSSGGLVHSHARLLVSCCIAAAPDRRYARTSELPDQELLYASETWTAARWVEFSLEGSQGIRMSNRLMQSQLLAG